MASEQTLAFIEDYKSYRALWDAKDKYYTNKSKRMEAYLVLAAKYRLTVKGVKNKIKSLRSYFSKEHQKVMEKTLSGEDSESSWFAYKPLLFISDSPMTHKDCVIPEGGSWTEDGSDVDAKLPRAAVESADIYNEEFEPLQHTEYELIKRIPQFSSLKSTLYRQRNQAKGERTDARRSQQVNLDQETLTMEGAWTQLLKMKAQFDSKIRELISEKCSPFLFSDEQYKCMIKETKEAKEKKQKGLHMKSKDYRRLKRFDVIKIGQREHLIQKSEWPHMRVRYFCPASELYEVLRAVHLKLDHRKEKAMESELKIKFCNITREVINVYLEFCETCALKKSGGKKEFVKHMVIDVPDSKVQAADEEESKDTAIHYSFQNEESTWMINPDAQQIPLEEIEPMLQHPSPRRQAIFEPKEMQSTSRKSRRREEYSNDELSQKSAKKTAFSMALNSITRLNDDHRVFGDFVASSLRNLKSDKIRRKLKLDIQRVILEASMLDHSEQTNDTT